MQQQLLEVDQRVVILRQRVQDLEADVTYLKRQAVHMKTFIGGLAVGGMGIVIFLLVKFQSVRDEETVHLYTELEQPSSKPPLWMLFFLALVGNLVTLCFIGPPSLRPALQSPAFKNIIRLYQSALLASLVFQLYSVVVKASAFGILNWNLHGNSRLFYWHMCWGIFALFIGNDTICRDCCLVLSMFQVFAEMIQFVRCHDTAVRRGVESMYPGDLYNFRQMATVNGPIFAFFIAVIWLLFPPSLFLGALIAAAAVAYIWLVIPFYIALNGIISFAYRFVVAYVRRPAPQVQVRLFGVDMMPLQAPQDEAAIRYVLYLDTRKGGTLQQVADEYQEIVDVFYTTGLTPKAWKTFLKINVLLYPSFTVMGLTAVRFYTGQGYISALVTTLSERHWWTYLASMTGMCKTILGFLGIY